jgi:DNA-binding MarR family transcriptional regulator
MGNGNGNSDSGDSHESQHIEQLIRLLKLGSLINGPMKDGVCDPGAISQLELKVMMALAGEGSLAGHDLVEIMGVPAMSVSRAIAALEARGWVEQAVDPENRRRKPVRLSAAGRAKYESLMPALADVARALVGGMSARQQREFAAIADQLVERMADWIVSHHEGVRLRG